MAVAKLDAERLRSTLATMLGPSDRAEFVDRPMAVSLTVGQVSYDGMFRAIFKQIDLLSETPGLPERSGLDDVFYRTLLLASHHEIFVRH